MLRRYLILAAGFRGDLNLASDNRSTARRSCYIPVQAASMHLYSGEVEVKCDGSLREAPGFNEDQLTDLFAPNYMDNFQKTLTWHCYRLALPVGYKVSRHDSRLFNIAKVQARQWRLSYMPS